MKIKLYSKKSGFHDSITLDVTKKRKLLGEEVVTKKRKLLGGKVMTIDVTKKSGFHDSISIDVTEKRKLLGEEETIEFLESVFEEHPDVESLDVIGNGMVPDYPGQLKQVLLWQAENRNDYTILQKVLSKNKTIKKLNVSHCEIEYGVASILSDLFSLNPYIEYLDLSKATIYGGGFTLMINATNYLNYNTIKTIDFKDNKKIDDNVFDILTTQKELLNGMPVLIPNINLTGTKCKNAISLIDKNKKKVENLIGSSQDNAAIVVINPPGNQWKEMNASMSKQIANNFITNQHIKVLIIGHTIHKTPISTEAVKFITDVIENSPTIKKIVIVDPKNLMPDNIRKQFEKTLANKHPKFFQFNSMFDVKTRQATTEAPVPSVGILKEKDKPDCLILLAEIDNKIQKMYWSPEKEDWMEFSKKPKSSGTGEIKWISIDKEQVLKIHDAVSNQPDVELEKVLDEVLNKRVFKKN